MARIRSSNFRGNYRLNDPWKEKYSCSINNNTIFIRLLYFDALRQFLLHVSYTFSLVKIASKNMLLFVDI